MCGLDKPICSLIMTAKCSESFSLSSLIDLALSPNKAAREWGNVWFPKEAADVSITAQRDGVRECSRCVLQTTAVVALCKFVQLDIENEQRLKDSENQIR